MRHDLVVGKTMYKAADLLRRKHETETMYKDDKLATKKHTNESHDPNASMCGEGRVGKETSGRSERM